MRVYEGRHRFVNVFDGVEKRSKRQIAREGNLLL